MLPTAVSVSVFVTVTSLSVIFLNMRRQRKIMQSRIKHYVRAEEESSERDLEPTSTLSPKKILARISFFLGVRSSRKVELELQKADIPLRASEFVVLNFLCAIIPLFLVFIGGRLVLSLFLSLLGIVLPQFYVKSRQVKRARLFSMQIPEALVMMSNSLKAGYSFLQAMELVSSETPEPIGREFGRALKEMNLGMTTEEALQAIVERVSSDDIDLVVTAVLIQRQVGGNLSEILDTIAFTIRERIRIKGEIQTLTAQGRISGMVIAGLPVGLGMFIYMMNPEYMGQLFVEPIGQLLVGVALVGQVIAVFMIRRIINIRV